jgi:hypothetical protein
MCYSRGFGEVLSSESVGRLKRFLCLLDLDTQSVYFRTKSELRRARFEFPFFANESGLAFFVCAREFAAGAAKRWHLGHHVDARVLALLPGAALSMHVFGRWTQLLQRPPD